MLDAPGLHRTAGAVLASTSATVMTAGTANVKGAYAQIIASTDVDAHFITIYLAAGSAAGTYLVDFAVGAAASERIIINNLISQPSHVVQNGYVYQFSIFIPAGTRIAARVQSNVASATMQICCTLGDYAFTGFTTLGVVETYGATTASSQGTVVDPGATANTKGAYVEMVATTGYPIRMLYLAFGHIGTTTTVTRNWFLDIATGAAASERVIIENVMIQDESTGDMCDPTTLGPFPVSIPAGVRIAARCQSEIATATARNLNLCVYGVA